MIQELKTFIAPYFCHYCRTQIATPASLCFVCSEALEPVLSHTHFIAHRRLEIHAVSGYKDPLNYLLSKAEEPEVLELLAQLLAQHKIFTLWRFDRIIGLEGCVLAQRVSEITGIELAETAGNNCLVVSIRAQKSVIERALQSGKKPQVLVVCDHF